MTSGWPLSGRTDELRRVAAAVRPGSAGVVVAGPAGVGKTRLAREALAGAGRRGAEVVWALGSRASRPVPLGAFAGMVDLRGGNQAEAITRALGRLARTRSLVLAVDDAHLLDEHSAIVLHRVVVRRVAPVLVTLRSAEPAPDTVTALWKDDHLPRLDLVPLDLESTTGLVARVLGGPVESASAARLWALTRGVPLFLRHLLDAEVEAGRLTPASGIWCWTRAPVISARLTEILDREIGALGPDVREVVDLVALAEPVDLSVLVGLTSPPALEEAEERGLVRTDGALVRLAHPLYGEVRRAAMGEVRARRLRGRAARALDGGTDVIPRAVLTLGSDLPADPPLFLRAAEAATRLFDLPLAERLARAAATTGDPAARVVHAAALSWLSRGEEAEAILTALLAETSEARVRAWAQLHRAGNLLWTLARPEGARQALADAEATDAAPQHVAAMTLALASACGDLSAALARGPDLLRSPLPDDLARVLVASAVSAAAALTGDLGLLDEAATVGGFASGRVPAAVPGFGLADLQVLGHRLAGTPGRVEGEVRRLRAVSADLPGPARLMGLVVGGHAALASGRVCEAATLLRDAWAGLRPSGHEFRFRCRTLLATALAQAGDAAAAAALLADNARGHPAYRLLEPDDELARAWLAAAEGSTSLARRRARATADLARARGAAAYEVLAWQTAVQLGGAEDAVDPLGRLAPLGPRARAAHQHAVALAGSSAVDLLAAAERWERLGDLVAATDAAAQAVEVHRRRGRRGAALAAAARARALADRSGARTPALAVAALPLPLTERQREIVALAARGLSNREIADRLCVSVRTVEGHLYRSGQRLGVSERTALPDVIEVLEVE